MVDRENVVKRFDEYYHNFKAHCIGDIEDHAMLKDVLELLREKQDEIIPYIDIDEAKCPVCKVKLTRQELLGEDVLFEDFFDYCPHCGKAVKWQ